MATTITRKIAKKATPEAVIAQAALANAVPEVTEPNAPVQAAAPAWERFPRSEDFGGEPINLPKYFGPKAQNSAGVAASWTNSATRLARVTKHGVKVTFNGETKEYKSVAEAFRDLRLPFEKHIKFRGVLKASKKEAFTNAKGEVFMFTLVEAAAAE